MKVHEIKNKKSDTTRIDAYKEHYKLTKREAVVAKTTLDEHLERGYTSVVQDKLKSTGIVSSQTVRHVKNGSTKNILVFQALLNCAIESKTQKESLKNLLK
jgi:hypothetical protein